MKYKSYSQEDTINLGKKIASKIKGGEVMCLYGTLGCGKTTFMKGFISYFLPNRRVLSPTFIIVRHYLINKNGIKNVFHTDLYRIENTEQISDLGLSEFMNQSDTIIAIEWADKMRTVTFKNRIDIYFKIIDSTQRLIEIKKT
jgi:tRNA threonylcarbamoyladenosine biosynthesis protein TsaE